MTKEGFWNLIDSVNALVPHEEHAAVLRETERMLRERSPEEILDWHLIMKEYHNAAYRNDLWAASAALGAHYSDDGFMDFRSWLISCGRQIYMAAMENPDSLAAVRAAGEDLNFESYGYAASIAYAQKMPEASVSLYDRIKSWKLTSHTMAEIQAELPQRPDIGADWSEETLPGLFPGICRKMMEERKAAAENAVVCGEMELLLNPEITVHAYVYEKGARNEYAFQRNPENIASFLGSRPRADKIILTTSFDGLILETTGGSIDRCPDKALLEKVWEALLPIQMGTEEAKRFFCPTMEEVEEYFTQRETAEMEML